MQGGLVTDKRASMVSDAELLRMIGHDLRAIYSEIIRQPLPRNIEAALARIDQAQSRTDDLRRPGARWA